MKQCPVCKTTYTDTTLRYCLADGAALGEDSGEPTLVRHDPIRFDIPGKTEKIEPVTTTADAGRSAMGTILKVFIGLIVLAAFGVIALAVLGVVYFNLTGNQTPAITPNQNIKVATSATPAAEMDETGELKEQIANLEKLLNEQKKSDKPSTIPLTLPNQSSTTTTATVNSPGDGFLALRTYPNSQAGTKILEIPHGATVSVGGCLNSSRIGNRSGRWCRASYDGYSGWVFDAFLIY